MTRIFLSNLGCKLNQAEVEALSRRFESDGHEIVGALERADVHIVNTCTVTHAAARDSRKLARRGGRVSSAMRTVLTGCYATDSYQQASALEGVSMVVPNSRKDDLVDELYQTFPDLAPLAPLTGAVPVRFVPLEFGNKRGAIKVEDGCNMTCSFCIIPSTRGRQRSRPISEVVRELNGLAEGGYQEIVVTGVQISSYRDEKHRLVDLVKSLLRETRIPRLRMSSIAPWQFDLALLDLWPETRLCRHFHLSLQSGSDSTLRRMRRPYTSRQYLELLDRLRARIDGIAITTDVIVGFPGESEREFHESLSFVEAAGFTRTHVFPYSERSGTRSANMVDSVRPEEKKARVRAMREVAAANAGAFARTQVGRPLSILWERELGASPGLATESGVTEFAVTESAVTESGLTGPGLTGPGATRVVGTSDNYLRVQAPIGPARRPGVLTTETPLAASGAVLNLSGSLEQSGRMPGGRVRLPVLG